MNNPVLWSTKLQYVFSTKTWHGILFWIPQSGLFVLAIGRMLIDNVQCSIKMSASPWVLLYLVAFSRWQTSIFPFIRFCQRARQAECNDIYEVKLIRTDAIVILCATPDSHCCNVLKIPSTYPRLVEVHISHQPVGARDSDASRNRTGLEFWKKSQLTSYFYLLRCEVVEGIVSLWGFTARLFR